MTRRLVRMAVIVIGFFVVSFVASWLQACIHAIAAPKGLVESEWFSSPSGRWHKNLAWVPERSTYEAHMAMAVEIRNELRRDWYKKTGEKVEEEIVPDDSEDACSRWVQENVLSLFDKRFVKMSQRERSSILQRDIDIPMTAEWYGFPFDGWEVRFESFWNVNVPNYSQVPLETLFGIDTTISRLPFSWWRPPYVMGTSVKVIPNRILPIVPRIPQALANGVITLAAIWGLWRLFKRIRSDRRELRGLCGRCAYPHNRESPHIPAEAGRTVGSVCSECGTPRRRVRVLW